MRNLFRKDKSNIGDTLEDFVLFKDETEVEGAVSGIENVTDDNENIENTNSIDVQAVSEALEKTKDKKTEKADKGALVGFIASHRALSACIAVVLILAIVAGGGLGIVMLSNPLYGYAQVAASKENIMRTMETTGTLASGDRYEITSLVAGKIISSGYEVGDEVSQNDVLYKLDDTEAKLAVERAKNEVEKAKDAALNPVNTTARITATESGVIQTLSIKTGTPVTAGSQIGTIKKTDGTIVPVFAYMSGQVTVVSVRVGQSVSVGQLIATVNTKSGSEQDAEYDKKSSEIDLQSVQRQLDNYTIKSPVTGVVVEKNAKAGDNVGVTDNSKPMMVILDTSTLNFTFSVDEYKIREIEKGQAAIITTDSIPDTTFSGTVTAVSTEGWAGEDGKPMYDVKVVISDPGDLKAGMNISAKIVLASVTNTISLPEKALMESDGENALVFCKIEDPDADLTESIENELAYPWIKVPKGCELRLVKYGISDGERVQILSGLKLGDIVVYDPDKDFGALVPTTLEIEDDDIEIDTDTDEEGLESEAEIEEALNQEIEKLISQQSNI